MKLIMLANCFDTFIKVAMKLIAVLLFSILQLRSGPGTSTFVRRWVVSTSVFVLISPSCNLTLQ